MKYKTLTFIVLVFSIAVFVALGNASAETLKTRIGELEFTHDFANGYPTDAAVEKIFDEMDFQRACQAYLWAIPANRTAKENSYRRSARGREHGQGKQLCQALEDRKVR